MKHDKLTCAIKILIALFAILTFLNCTKIISFITLALDGRFVVECVYGNGEVKEATLNEIFPSFFKETNHSAVVKLPSQLSITLTDNTISKNTAQCIVGFSFLYILPWLAGSLLLLAISLKSLIGSIFCKMNYVCLLINGVILVGCAVFLPFCVYIFLPMIDKSIGSNLDMESCIKLIYYGVSSFIGALIIKKEINEK